MPTRLFADSANFSSASSCNPTSPDSVCIGDTMRRCLVQHEDAALLSLPSPISILDAVTSSGARVGVANMFTATILRVFRRVWSLRSDGDADIDGIGGSVSQEVLRRARLAGTQRSHWRLVIILRSLIIIGLGLDSNCWYLLS